MINLITYSKKLFRLLLSKKYRRERYYSNLLKHSEYFDAKWYLSEYPDIARAGIVPEEHYIRSGYREGRLPGPLFDEEFYLSQITAPIQRDLPPIIHYELYGRRQCIEPERRLDAKIWWKSFKEPKVPDNGEHIIDKLSSKGVTIVIPVFNGAQFVKKCIESVIQLKGDFDVIIIDDCSDKTEVSNLLNSFSHLDNVTILRNSTNLGFTKTINRGIQEAAGSDIIILNSDTIVPKSLIVNLKYAAYIDEKIGTVTPLSNSAGPFSIPTEHVSAQLTTNPNKLTRLLSQGILLKSLYVPTGHGFCMYIKSNVFKSVGYFDEEAFPRGYGEENDFCFKARSKGWKNAVDPCTFVYHDGGKSFKAEKQSLVKTGIAKLNERYKGYNAQIQEGFSSKSFLFMKKRISTLMDNFDWFISQSKPRILYVIATEDGGTAKTNKDLMKSIQDKYETFLLKSNSRRLSLYVVKGKEEVHIQTFYLNSHIEPFPHNGSEYDSLLLHILHLWSIELIHIRQIAWHSLGFVEKALKLGIPTVYSIHDFYPVCPSVKLLDNDGNYCAGKCTKGFGICNVELWPKEYFTNLKHHEITNWREMFSKMLTHVHTIITTSEHAKYVTQQNLPIALEKPFRVIPHGRDFTKFIFSSRVPKEGKNVKLLMLGTMVKSKGSDFILPILEKFSNIEIHLLGKLEGMEISHPRYHEYGSYQRDELSFEIEKITPHWGLLLSIWPETWCHTLTEMWANGLPVVAFDNGAVKERIDANGCGVLVENADIDSLINVLNKVSESEYWQKYANNVIQWQTVEGKEQNLKEMSRQYTEVYNDVMG